MKQNTLKKLVLGGLGLSLVVSLGCGGNGASNNDQGVSVTFLGFFQGADTSKGVAGAYLPLAAPGTEPTSLPSGAGVDTAGGVIAYAGVRNNLTGQFFRADRVLYDFTIPGSSSQPPSTNYPVSMVIGAGSSGTTTPGDGVPSFNSDPVRNPSVTSLPPGFSAPNPVFAQVPMVPFQIFEWLNFNRNALPEPPFIMEASVRVAGLTSSGDRLETNTETVAITILPENFVAPTDGSSSSNGGTGGASTGSFSDGGAVISGDGDSSTTHGGEGATL